MGGYHSGLALLSLGVRESRFKLLGLVSPRIQDNPQTVTLETVFAHCGSAIIEDGQRSGTVSWVPSDELGVHQPLSTVIGVRQVEGL